jgi:hypothetical protein
VIAEYIPRTALARIAGNAAVLQHFANADTLMKFWALTAPEREKIWGAPVSIDDALQDYDPRHISDGQLGRM